MGGGSGQPENRGASLHWADLPSSGHHPVNHVIIQELKNIFNHVPKHQLSYAVAGKKSA